ncbi:hypothetical protein V9T40_004950 [Parthenolecanium corni]|uniref:Fibronectin type-III domain-containing protein n=1 Tax=Parthenolecanium corni TaxID=536013 RepID=A0AAN9TD85_9HEMI
MLGWLYTVVLLSVVCISVAELGDDADDAAVIPPTPITMSKVLISKNKMKLQWNWPFERRHFIVQYNNNSVEVNDNWVLLTNLLPYTNYSIVVLACTDSCVNVFGPEVYRTKMGSPGLVENFDLSQANASHVLLSWDAPLVPAGPNQFYQVQILDHDSATVVKTTATNIFLPRPACENGGSSTSQKVFVRGVSVDPEAASVQYYGNTSSSVILYVDCLWESSKELAREFKVDKMVVSKTSIKLWWKAAKNDSYYLVTYNEQSARVRGTSVVLANLTPNTLYTIRVSACSADGDCAVSTLPLKVRTKLGMPDKVENLGVTKVNATTFLVSWQPPSTTSVPELFYRVRIQSSLMEAERTFDTDRSEALIQTADCEVEESSASYTAIVTAVNPNEGNELVGEPVNATVFIACARFEVPPPQLPYVASIDIGSTWIKLQWSSTLANTGTYYFAAFNGDAVRVTDSQMLLQDLFPNTSYVVQLYECLQNCTSFFGPVSMQTRALIPISVSDLSIVEVNSTHFRINWQPPLVLAESNLTYQLTLGGLEVITDSTNFTEPKLICKPKGSLLTASVKLAHFTHSVYASESVSITTPHPCLRLESTFTQVLTHDSFIFLEWTPVDAGNSESVYKISYNDKVIEVNKTAVQLENLEPSTMYEIQAAICISGECYNLIKPLTVHTHPRQLIPPKPLIMELINSSHALLSWTPNPVFDNENCSYSVQIKFSNSSLLTTSADSLSKTMALPTSHDVYPNSSSYVIEVVSSKKVCSPSDQPPVISVLQETFDVKELINDSELPMRIEKVVALPTTIELEWNGTDIVHYSVLCNQFATNVSLPHIELTGLVPGSDYSIEILKCLHGSCNTSAIAPFTIRTPPQLVSVQNVNFISASPQVMNISWQPPDSWQPSDGIDWRYQVLVNVDSVKSLESISPKPFMMVRLPEFDTQLEVVAHIMPISLDNRNLIGLQTVASISLQASPKAFINQIDAGSEQITLTWSDYAAGNDSVYAIKCNETISDWSNDTSMSATISDLAPDSVYSLQLLKCSRHACGQLIGSSVVRTHKSDRLPIRVDKLEMQIMNSTHVHLNWSAPMVDEVNSSYLAYQVRLVQTAQTNGTEIYLPNACQSVLRPDTYEIAVQATGRIAAWTSIARRCQPDPVFGNYYDGQAYPATNIIIFVALAGFLVGAAVCACSCRTFTYTYKVKGDRS